MKLPKDFTKLFSLYKKYIFAAMAVFVLVLLVSCGNGSDKEVEIEIPKMVVETISLTERPQYSISEVGTIKPKQEIEIIAKTTGIIDSINAVVGQAIQKDASMVVIDHNDPNNSARLNLETAEVQLRNAQTNLSIVQGNNNDTVRKTEFSVDNMSTTLDKMRRNLDELKVTNQNSLITLESALSTAESSYENAKVTYENSLDSYDQSWEDFYIDTEIAMNSILSNADNTIKTITGIINTSNEQTISLSTIPFYYGALDQKHKNNTVQIYNSARRLYKLTEEYFSNITPLTPGNTVEALNEVKTLSEQTQDLTEAMRELLNDSITTSELSSTQLATYRTSISTINTLTVTGLGTVNTAIQTQKSTTLSESGDSVVFRNNMEIAYNRWTDAKEALQNFTITSKSTEQDLADQIDQTEKQLTSAEADLTVAKRTGNMQNRAQQVEIDVLSNQYRLAMSTFDDTDISSPLDGYVSELTVDVGDYVSAGMTIGKVIQYEDVKIVFYVDKENMSRLDVGMPITFETPTLGNIDLIGHIEKISPMADSLNKKFKIEAVATNTSLALKPEMFVNVNIDITMNTFEDNKIYVPLNAVIVDQNKQSVYVVKDGISALKIVEVGAIYDKWIEIKTGLTKEDQLIVEGHRNLESGVEVQIKN